MSKVRIPSSNRLGVMAFQKKIFLEDHTLINLSLNELITTVFSEQPRLHRVSQEDSKTSTYPAIIVTPCIVQLWLQTLN